MHEYTLLELSQGLNDGLFTSVSLVNMYLERIYQFDSLKINSIAEVNPEVFAIAESLDLERKQKGPRSILHGIPIVVKDNINTYDKMHTTAGSLALNDLYAPYDASIIAKLKDAGVIILGKANMSEFAYFMSSNNMPSGFSSRGGQVKSPYHEKLDPSGSSTGSAVAVSCNFIPASIGTETNGSLMSPAINNNIVSIKPTLGLVSRYGIIPITATQDTAGPMGRTVEDCAILLNLIYGQDKLDVATLTNPRQKYDFLNACYRDVKGLKVGIINYLNKPYNEEELTILNEARDLLESAGVQIINFEYEAKGISCGKTMVYEFKNDLNYYLNTVKGYTKMTSLADIIKFNEEDPQVRMPYGQSILVDADKHSLPDSEYFKIRLANLQEANKFVDLMNELQLNAIISPRTSSHAPVAGLPCLCVPAKPLINLYPKNLIFTARKWDDEVLFSLGYLYESKTRHRISPTLIR